MAFPCSKPKKTKPVKFVYMLMLRHKDSVYMYQRPASGIWGGLFSFPEFDDLPALEQGLNQMGLGQYVDALEFEEEGLFRHTFSHYHLDIQPVTLAIKQKPTTINDCQTLWMSGHGLDTKQKVGLSAVATKLLARL